MMTEWAYFKQLMTAKAAYPQFLETTDFYHLKLYEGPVLLAECRIDKNKSLEDKEDFETNHKALSNQSVFNQFDTDGAQIIRLKAAKRGWSFWAVPIEITSSTINGSIYLKDANGNDITWVTCKIYDDSNNEITTPGLLNANLGQCTKTVIDFEPPFDYELIGGSLRINSNPTQDVRLWIVAAPDIPAINGGSKEFASGINLKFMSADSPLEIDGRVSKFLSYNATAHSSKLRMILKHPAGVSVNMLITIQVYRQ